MSDTDQEVGWDEIKSVWNNSARYAAIRIEVEGLVSEFKTKISPFERQAIRDDIETIKKATSDFEKRSIKRDLDMIKKLVIKLIRKFLKD
jgi:hypothetical protein